MIKFKNKKGVEIKKFCNFEDLNKYCYQRLELFFSDFLKIKKYDEKKFTSPFKLSQLCGFFYTESTRKFTHYGEDHVLTWSSPFNLVKSLLYFNDSGILLSEWNFSKGDKDLNKKYIIKTTKALEEWLGIIFTKENQIKKEMW